MSGDGQSISVNAAARLALDHGVLVLDVKRYGATGDSVGNPLGIGRGFDHDDWPAIQQAINDAYTIGGATVYIPPGKYSISAPLQFPPQDVNGGALFTTSLWGDGQRSTQIYPRSNGQWAIVIGNMTYPVPASPNNAGAVWYGAIRELSIVGSLANHGGGMWCVGAKRWIFERVHVESFNAPELQCGATGIATTINVASGNTVGAFAANVLQGKFVVVTQGTAAGQHGTITANTAGLNPSLTVAWHSDSAAAATDVTSKVRVGGHGFYLQGGPGNGGPGPWRNTFIETLTATVIWPLTVENADENEFISPNFGMEPGVTAANRSLFGTWLRQGRNNRFFGGLIQGSVGSSAPYVGCKFGPALGGDCKANQFYGDVLEGFDLGIWNSNDASTFGNGIFNPNFSIVTTNFVDDAATAGNQSGLYVLAPIHKIAYFQGQRSYGPTLTFPANNATPSVQGSDSWATANGLATTYTNFLNGQNGQEIEVRFDAFSTLQQGALKLAGQMDYKCTGLEVFRFVCLGGNWTEVSRTMQVRAPGRTGVSANRGDANVVLVAASDEPTQKFDSALTANRTVTVPNASIANGTKFRIVRTANATGAFNLTVQTSTPSTLKVLTAASQWCDVEYDGANWNLTSPP